MTEKTPNYSPAQEALIVEAVRANGNVANIEVATALAANPAMNSLVTGERKPRAITAKMSRMAEANGFKYERKVPVSKSGGEIIKKTDLVARIAALAGVTASKLDGLDKAPKLALDTLATVFTDYKDAQEFLGEREAA